MSVFDRIFGGGAAQRPSSSADEQAIARYRYLIKTAPPEAIEEAHAEAFARLTPEQRRRVLDELGAELPSAEREAAMRSGDAPQALARTATRAEFRQPGAMERAFGRVGGAGGFGSMLAGSFLGAMIGSVLGTAIAQNFLGGDEMAQGDSGQSADSDAWHDGGLADAGEDAGGFDVDGGFDI